MREILKKLVLLIREDSIRKMAHATALIIITSGMIWLTYILLIDNNEKNLNEPIAEDIDDYQAKYTADQSSFDPEILEANRKAWTSSYNKHTTTRFRDFVYTIFFHPAIVFFFAIIVNVIVLGSIVVYFITKHKAEP